MPVRYTYIVSINKAPEQVDEYQYAYAQTKGVAISIGKNGAKIVANIGKDYRDIWEGSYAQKLVYDGIRRCSLIHTLKYRKPMPIDSIVISIFKGTMSEARFDVTNKAIVYSLIKGKLIRPIAPNLLEKTILHEIIGEMKKDYGNRMASLYAYLLSKSKTYEAEKFVYLWMAFNGVYNYWGESRGIKNDRAQLENLLEKYGWGKKILCSKDRKKVGKKVSLIIYMYKPCNTSEDICSSAFEDLQQKILNLPEIKSIGISFFGLLLCEFSYYLRCTMIHADQPLPLFAFENDIHTTILKTANIILETFLDNHLYECFDERNCYHV